MVRCSSFPEISRLFILISDSLRKWSNQWDLDHLAINKDHIYTRGDSPIKMTRVLVGNFEKNPQKVPESRLVGVAKINFHP